MSILGIFFILMGLLQVLKPYEVAEFSEGWKSKSSLEYEPSEGYLFWIKILGYFFLILGLAMVVSSFIN